MPYRLVPFVEGQFYHIYNRGISRRNIFSSLRDYQRFLEVLFYYQLANPKPKFSARFSALAKPQVYTNKTVELVCFCLMPNHFHLLIKEVTAGSISEFMRRFIHSYTKYFNLKHKNAGPILQAMFKAVIMETDEQLIHVSRYIHLNPFVSGIVKDLDIYPWSSYHDFVGDNDEYPLAKGEILGFFKSKEDYKQFVLDQADYGTTLEILKHAALDAYE